MIKSNYKIKMISALIAQYLTGDISNEELTKLAHWVNKHTDNTRYFNELMDTWRFTGTIKCGVDEETKNAFNKLKNRIQKPVSNTDLINGKRTDGIEKRRRFPQWLAIAASVFLLSIIGGSITYSIISKHRKLFPSPQAFKISTPYGTRSELTLADGSTVWLNAGSMLTYDENFNIQRREVNLIGEAYFQVKENKNIPFIVSSGDLTIKAVGTSFNVKAYPDDEILTATLIEGKIIVMGKSADEGKFEYILKPNQHIIFRKTLVNASEGRQIEKDTEENRLEKKNIQQELKNTVLEDDVNTVIYTSWKDKRWVIEQEPFPTLAVMLERRYNVRILFNHDDLKDFSFSGIIENETLEQVFHILQLSAPLKYEFGKGEVKVEVDMSQLGKFQMYIKNKEIIDD